MDFLPKEGISQVISQAVNSGFTSPVIYFVATTSYKNDQMPGNLNPHIDLETGGAPVWLYQIRENTDTTKKLYYGVIKIKLLGVGVIQSIEISENDLGMDMPAIGTPLPGKNWMDSDSMVISLKNNIDFQNFKSSHTNTIIQVTIVGMNTFNPIFELGKPYWFGIITGDNAEQSLNCITDCWSGETTCLEINAVVEDNNGNYVKLYPNPASNYLNMEIPETWDGINLTVKIFDIAGNEVMNAGVQRNMNYLNLPLDYLPNGNYLISISDGKNTVQDMFVVNH
ncbi:MAG: hypothetical protein A2X64_04315 [Ignavibacteria bacterium GWF2_33_9]|nr:MAG: hypothetical protein A2X64_04315 [Ignavibacteria bacterium GWF2_33_9]